MLKGERRREEILRTAESLFYAQGYERTTIQQILTALGLSKGGFYHHFASKEALLQAICDRKAQATGAYIAADPKLNAVAAVYSSPLERTRETAGAILDALNPVRAGRGEEPLELITDPRVIEAGNEFRGKRIGHGKGALWRDGNWKLVLNLWKPSWGESYRHIAERVGAFANEKIREYAGRQIIVVSHESPIWSYRHLLETGHPEHWMFLRKTALASITSITYDSDTGKVMSITYADPAAQVE